MGISGVVHAVAFWNGVLALGIGLVFGYMLEPGMMRRKRESVATAPVMQRRRLPAFNRSAADEPTKAEREEAAATSDSCAADRDTTTVR